MRYLLCLLLALMLLGWTSPAKAEVGTAVYAVRAVGEAVLLRRVIVGDDWVLVKSTGELHRRYVVSKGFWIFRRYRGNPELLEAVGPIVRGNDQIVVYGSYERAKLAGVEMKVAQSSLAYVPPPNEKLPFYKRWWRKRVMHTL